MHTATVLLRLGLVVLVLAALPASAHAAGKDSYRTAFMKWVDFSRFTLEGTKAGRTGLVLDFKTTKVEQDPGDMYTGGLYEVGEATGPVLNADFGFTEAIASWNADTPPGTWIEVQMRAYLGGTPTKWYNMGVWAADDKATNNGVINRHSVSSQSDEDGYVAVDTLVLTAKKAVADGIQLKVRLFSADNGLSPTLRRLSVAYNTAVPKAPVASAPSGEPRILLDSVPACSQMIYPDGGNVWCSPTSTSMVLGFWGADAGPCEPRVRAAVKGVYDYTYRGHGNWPFNTAYAASRGMEAYVARFTGLDKVEPWVRAGVPVVVSYAWKKGELTGAPISSSSGHLGVIVGFEANGDPIVNDPAAASNEKVQRTYSRTEFEPLWLANSGGTVYLIFPPDYQVPGL